MKARRVVDALRRARHRCRPRRVGVHQCGITIELPRRGARRRGTPTTRRPLEAQVMRNGMLVGFVPEIPGSDSVHRGTDHRRDRAHRLRQAGRHADLDSACHARNRLLPIKVRASCSAGSWTGSATAERSDEHHRARHHATEQREHADAQGEVDAGRGHLALECVPDRERCRDARHAWPGRRSSEKNIRGLGVRQRDQVGDRRSRPASARTPSARSHRRSGRRRRAAGPAAPGVRRGSSRSARRPRPREQRPVRWRPRRPTADRRRS